MKKENKVPRNVENIPLSNYGQFVMDLIGYTVYKDGKKLHRYETYNLCKDAIKVITRQVPGVHVEINPPKKEGRF